MNVLAIHSGHNATAALAVDGQVVAAVSQEKVDGVKNSAAFPAGATEWCLNEAGLDRSRLDKVVVAGREVLPESCYAYLFDRPEVVPARDWRVELAKRLEAGGMGKVLPGLFRALRRQRHRRLLARGREELAAKLTAAGLPGDRIEHLDHQDCHARAAFHALDDSGGALPALILTLDGSGDGIAGTVSTWRPGEGWRRLAEVPMAASLGGYYSNTTRFLGMKVLEHEYKVMGLAPYCKGYHLDVYRRIFAGVVDLDPANPLTFKAAVDAVTFYDYLSRSAVGERFDNIAGAVQHLLEERVTAWARAAVAATGIGRVFTGGGVFMNVKLNKRLLDLPEIEAAHFMPSCGDESLPIGAAYAASAAAGLATRPLRDLYLGRGYSDAELRAFILGERLAETHAVEEPADIEERAAELLAAGEVVARFAGRCEWGARSLGNRAILAHPGRMESFHTVNDQIKARDFWMPFAPSMLDRRARDYLRDFDPARDPARFMVTAYDATPAGLSELRAALHQGDHTLRPQVVTADANPAYYRLIEAFERRTGTGAVLNTSLNLHGHPLVATPEQALFTLERSGLRHLALGRFLISKR